MGVGGRNAQLSSFWVVEGILSAIFLVFRALGNAKHSRKEAGKGRNREEGREGRQGRGEGGRKKQGMKTEEEIVFRLFFSRIRSQ